MELSKDTKLKDILEAYPEVKEKIAEINPKFKMLNTPVGKMMLKKATIADMSEKSGMSIDDIIVGLKKLIAQ